MPKLVKVVQKLEATTQRSMIKISFVAPFASCDAVLNNSRKIKAGRVKIKIDFIVRLRA